MIINCAIIDDEPLAAGLLKSYVQKTPFLNLIGTYGSAIEAMKELRSNPAQLLFLDIQMPELSELSLRRYCPKTRRSSLPRPSSNMPSRDTRWLHWIT